jgi:hypothetical protein
MLVNWADTNFYDRPTLHHPTAPDGLQNIIDHTYPKERRGDSITIRVYGPLRPPMEHAIRLPLSRGTHLVQPDPPRTIRRPDSRFAHEHVGAVRQTVPL